MKVVCISENWYSNISLPANHPKVGGIYTVTEEGECPCGHCGQRVLHLEECPPDIGWRAIYFAPLSELDETVIHSEYILQTT